MMGGLGVAVKLPEANVISFILCRLWKLFIIYMPRESYVYDSTRNELQAHHRLSTATWWDECQLAQTVYIIMYSFDMEMAYQLR